MAAQVCWSQGEFHLNLQELVQPQPVSNPSRLRPYTCLPCFDILFISLARCAILACIDSLELCELSVNVAYK